MYEPDDIYDDHGVDHHLSHLVERNCYAIEYIQGLHLTQGLGDTVKDAVILPSD